MFLKNYYKAVAALMAGTTTTLKKVSGVEASFLGTSGSSGAYSWLQMYSRIQKVTLNGSINAEGIFFGTGTTAPTLDDYTLSGELAVTSSNGSAASKVSGVEDDTGWTISAVYTITNTSDADITIGEIGLVASCNGVYPMIERTVLDSPVTIPPGGVGQVTYTIRMNYPT